MIKIKLGSKIVTDSSLPYIIAEIGVNHECSLSKAKKLILNAKKGGAHAAKFQTYKAHLITSRYAPSYWDIKKEKTKDQRELHDFLWLNLIDRKNDGKSLQKIIDIWILKHSKYRRAVLYRRDLEIPKHLKGPNKGE